MSALLKGKRGLILGVASERSLAWGIAERCAEQGASLALSYQGARLLKRVRPLATQIGAQLLGPCDVQDEAALDLLFEQVEQELGGLDFLVHSLAYAPREALKAPFLETTRGDFSLSFEVSCYSLLGLARRAAPLMERGGSLLALSYYGAEKVVPHYKVMGPAKAALESSIRYLAAELGPQGIRVNGISAGPVRTLAAAGIPGLRALLSSFSERAPLRRQISRRDVGEAAVFLLSQMSSAITGEILHVDAGFHITAG